jgi:transcriptional regulator with XRE-family HTH domain
VIKLDEISFGEWLRRQRKALGLTQKQLAERVNCATITLRKIEAQQRRPSVQIAIELAQVLGIPSGEYASFLQFARGYKQFTPVSAIDLPPWRLTMGSLVIELPPAQASLLDGDPNPLNRNGYVLDAESFWATLDIPARKVSADWIGDITPEGMSSNQDNIHMLMVIPVEVPAQLANMLLQDHAVSKGAGIFSRIMTGT